MVTRISKGFCLDHTKHSYGCEPQILEEPQDIARKELEDTMSTNGAKIAMENGNENQDGLVVPIQINGNEIQTTSTLEVVSPNRNEVCWKTSIASPKDAIRAVEAAQAAFPGWSTMTLAAKSGIFLKIADILENGLTDMLNLCR